MSIFDEAKQILKGSEVKTKNIYFLSHLYSWNSESIGISLNINKYLGLPRWALKKLIEIIAQDINYRGGIYFNFKAGKKEKDKILLARISTVFGCSTETAGQIRNILNAHKMNPYKEFGINKGK